MNAVENEWNNDHPQDAEHARTKTRKAVRDRGQPLNRRRFG